MEKTKRVDVQIVTGSPSEKVLGIVVKQETFVQEQNTLIIVFVTKLIENCWPPESNNSIKNKIKSPQNIFTAFKIVCNELAMMKKLFVDNDKSLHASKLIRTWM